MTSRQQIPVVRALATKIIWYSIVKFTVIIGNEELAAFGKCIVAIEISTKYI